MKMGILTLAAAATMTMNPIYACGQDGHDGFLPENDMWIGVNSKSAGGITEAEFNDVLDRVEDIYAPVISGRGKNFQIVRNWTDGTVNAYAQQSGNTWKISMFGGLARHETINSDGFALVACHETGHHLGGEPKKKSWWSSSWASNEGQSDYFGALKCLRKYMENDDNQAIVAKLNVPAQVTAECQSNHTAGSDVALCQRVAMAGLSTATLLGTLGGTPVVAFDTPDSSVVSSTNHNHPKAQCRLDTYFAASLCDKSADEDIVEGDVNAAQCARVDGYSIQARPKCWYKP